MRSVAFGFLLLACGSDATGGASDSAGGPDASAACPVCANPSFTCSAEGAESADFHVEAQSEDGCSGHIVQAGGPTDAYSIDCARREVCGPAGCLSGVLTDDSFTWGTSTCSAASR